MWRVWCLIWIDTYPLIHVSNTTMWRMWCPCDVLVTCMWCPCDIPLMFVTYMWSPCDMHVMGYGQHPLWYVTWSRGMSRMSLILILSYRLKQMTYSYVLHCLEIQRIAHISWTRCRIVMGYGSKCRIWYVQVDYIENSNLNITDKWLISLDHVTYFNNNKSDWLPKCKCHVIVINQSEMLL